MHLRGTALASLLLALTTAAAGQETRVLEGAVLPGAEGYDLEHTVPAREQGQVARQRVRIASAHPALQALVDQTIRVEATFLEVDGALGEDDPGAAPVRTVRLRFLDPQLTTVRGRVQAGPSGAVLVSEAGAPQAGAPQAPQGLRLEGERSLLLLASVQEREVELEGWRFSGARPFLVAGLAAQVTSQGYLSVAQRSSREMTYRKLGDVAVGERLFVSRLALHRRGDQATPFRDLSELDLAYLDVDGNDQPGDEDMDVLMAFTRPAVSPQGAKVPAGFIPLRKLDLGSPEMQRRLGPALVGVETQAPAKGGIIQAVKPAVR